MSSKFDKFNAEVASDLIAFWQAQAEDVHWITPPTTILDDTNPPFYRWMTGGQINGCYNAVDVHVEQGRGDDIAIIYDSPV
ncbi:MAG: acetyl-coenzyme A synthetase N-terminal domain-containing protein, partial [Candidatus Puniceispirillaceae bacterium]